MRKNGVQIDVRDIWYRHSCGLIAPFCLYERNSRLRRGDRFAARQKLFRRTKRDEYFLIDSLNRLKRAGIATDASKVLYDSSDLPKSRDRFVNPWHREDNGAVSSGKCYEAPWCERSAL